MSEQALDLTKVQHRLCGDRGSVPRLSEHCLNRFKCAQEMEKMKVLVCHNRYRSKFPSGENRYVEDEIALLRNAGIDIVRMTEESDSLNNGGPLHKANAALGLMYSPTGVRRFQRLLRYERPDVVHIHNVFPLISPP